MNTKTGPSIIEISFNEVVENVNRIAREARHMNISTITKLNIYYVTKLLENINFDVAMINNADDYLMCKSLDLLDFLKDKMNELDEKNSDYIALNSVYDAMREFYFNNK